jgi:cleavage and polyadenylation specificity factor subunit 4
MQNIYRNRRDLDHTFSLLAIMAAANPLVGPSPLKDIINPQFHQNSFPTEAYIKSDLGIKLDKGASSFYPQYFAYTDSDDQICRLFLTPAGCPLGPLHCPLRHTSPSAQNFQPPKPLPTHPRERERVSTVCKHWLRGLCKKGDACEFLHEYNLRRMPECYWFAKYGYCSAGDECLYAHPKERKIECPDYNRGFCKLGEWFSLCCKFIHPSPQLLQKVRLVLASMFVKWRANSI